MCAKFWAPAIGLLFVQTAFRFYSFLPHPLPQYVTVGLFWIALLQMELGIYIDDHSLTSYHVDLQHLKIKKKLSLYAKI